MNGSPCVSQLINSVTHTWDVDTLIRNFDRREVNQILSIPLSIFNREDQLVWHFEKGADYSVRSCYQVAKRLGTGRPFASNGVIESSSVAPSSSRIFWIRLWKINFPSKIKIFIQLLCLERLLCNEALHNRLAHFNPECPFCGDNEYVDHLFFLCPHAIVVWFISPLSLRSTILTGATIIKKWIRVCDTLCHEQEKQELIQLFAFLLWHIWKDRNDYIFKHSNKTTGLSAAMAVKAWEEFRDTKEPTPFCSVPNNQSPSSWQPPPVGFLKLNFDGRTKQGGYYCSYFKRS